MRNYGPLQVPIFQPYRSSLVLQIMELHEAHPVWSSATPGMLGSNMGPYPSQ
jgi:hypothetical protein